MDKNLTTTAQYDTLLTDIGEIIQSSRLQAVQSVNAVMTATYWLIGRHIVEFEQQGETRAEYGQAVLKQLAVDLSQQYKRGFSARNLRNMRLFYLTYKNIWQKPSAKFELSDISNKFPLPWASYTRLISVKDDSAREFYEKETLRNGWSSVQLNRQIESQFYTRALLSKQKADILNKRSAQEDGGISPEQEFKNPYVLEFLDLKDEYSESDLEQALIERLEDFLMELGGDFAFIGRQRRLRIDDEWFRVDLVFYHRRLRCLVLIDLKLGKFSHADAGQMHMYLNYAREHWSYAEENPPVGLILCAEKGEAIAKYALEGLPNKVLAAQYKTSLPNEQLLIDELKKQQKLLGERLPTVEDVEVKLKKKQPLKECNSLLGDVINVVVVFQIYT